MESLGKGTRQQPGFRRRSHQGSLHDPVHGQALVYRNARDHDSGGWAHLSCNGTYRPPPAGKWDQLNWLIGRNGYNGTILWKQKLPDDYLVHRSAFIATKDTFYRINGNSVLMLDARTGEKTGEIRIPDFPGDFKWIAME